MFLQASNLEDYDRVFILDQYRLDNSHRGERALPESFLIMILVEEAIESCTKNYLPSLTPIDPQRIDSETTVIVMNPNEFRGSSMSDCS